MLSRQSQADERKTVHFFKSKYGKVTEAYVNNPHITPITTTWQADSASKRQHGELVTWQSRPVKLEQF